MNDAIPKNDFMVVFIARDREGLVAMAQNHDEATRRMRLFIAEQDHLAGILRFDIRIWTYHDGFMGAWINVRSILVTDSLKKKRRQMREESQGGESHEEAA